MTESHVITFQKQLINLPYQPAWAILVELGEINMIPLIGGGLLYTNGCFDLGWPCLIVDLNICWYKLVFNFDLVTFCCRFPVSTKSCFDLSMPYVYWARGEIKMATYSFFALIQKEKRGMNLSGVVIFFI